MERTIQPWLAISKKAFCFFPLLVSRRSPIFFAVFGFMMALPSHGGSHPHVLKDLKTTPSLSETASSSAKAPLCQILFYQSTAALTSQINELTERGTINSIGSIARHMHVLSQEKSNTFWITNQSSNIFAEPTAQTQKRLKDISADYEKKTSPMSAHDVLLVHSLVGAHQISDFFHQILEAQYSFNHESRGQLSVEERSKQSVKSTAVAFFLTYLIAPATMPLAILPAQYLYYWHQEKIQLERTFQAISAIQILLNHPYQNAVGIISLDQYTLSRPNILKQDYLTHQLSQMTSSGNLGVLQANISMNIPAMRMFLELAAKSQKNEKLGHHQKLMFDFVFESSEDEEPRLHLVIRTENPHLYSNK